jgi:AcrR family transcriptional regulator
MAKSATKRGALSRELVLRAALGIVDEEGLGALSMRRIGEAVGVEAMSLYNHVTSKAALLDGVFELILDELPPAKRAASWQALLYERACALQTVLRAHPNALPLFSTRSAVTPAALSHVELVLAALRSAGFSPRAALCALQVLFTFVIGHTVSAYGTRRLDEISSPAYAKLSPETFPRVREAANLLTTHDAERELRFGLDAFLGGLEQRLQSQLRSQ